jgi:hypothetical protein
MKRISEDVVEFEGQELAARDRHEALLDDGWSLVAATIQVGNEFPGIDHAFLFWLDN